MNTIPLGDGTRFTIYTCKDLDTMNVRYIETGGWEITAPNGTKHRFRKTKEAIWQVQRLLHVSAKEAHRWMLAAKAAPVSFDDFIPHYAEIVRLRGGRWQLLTKESEWEDVGAIARVRRFLRWNTDLTPKEMERVLGYVQRRDATQ